MPNSTTGDQALDRAEGGLDVDWLIHKKDPQNNLKRSKSVSETSNTQPTTTPAPAPAPTAALQVPTIPPSTSHEDPVDPLYVPEDKAQVNGNSLAHVPTIKQPASVRSQSQQKQTPPASKPTTQQKVTPAEDGKQGRLSLKKDGRRSSWLSSLGSKFSGSDKLSRSNSVSSTTSKTKDPQPSPSFERPDPFNAQKSAAVDVNNVERPTHTRRPSVLVAAGTETKLDNHPGFLSNAFRRLSSGNTATLGKAATGGAVCPRKILNIDPYRHRTTIPEFDTNKLRRVAFRVDVEIAGFAAQSDEQEDHKAAVTNAVAAAYGRDPVTTKDSKMAKYKDRSEGAALKKTTSREAKMGSDTGAKPETTIEAQEDSMTERVKHEVEEDEARAENKADEISKDAEQPTTTRKKEKKKRSEAERKERKEKKRRHAEANGLIPLELTVDDDTDSSGATGTPPGASTPRKGQPTTDPLRIYKRCCQLRETTALPFMKDQISNPSATLAEAPGTVACIDLSGNEMPLQDLQTLGDWLAVVPVRKLVLDECNLTDEAVRIVLSGLSGCKNQEQTRLNRKLPRSGSDKHGFEQMGVIERLSMKNNPSISAIGWKYIALFVHTCQSLLAIDLSGIPFPANAKGDLSRTSTRSINLSSSQELPPKSMDLSTLFSRALGDRFGDRLQELILSSCGLISHAVGEIIDSVIKCKLKRLGLAKNNLDIDAIRHVVRYVTSGACEGLDMGGNDLREAGHLLTEVLDERNPLFAISLADCNLSVQDLRSILQHLSLLHNFKFMDLSRNHDLFSGPEDAVSLLRRRLPQMKDLKRIHLADTSMSPNQVIALAEVFPDCPALAHVSLLDNQQLIDCMNSTNAESQEEACAVFVSLMTAVRASKTLVAVEIEVPSQESSEVIKALSSQVVAYSLRNLERTTLTDYGVEERPIPGKFDKNAPEVLLHLVGHMDGYSENHDADEPAPDADYMMATNGIVKALGVCLTTKEASRMQSRNISPAASGTATPRSGYPRPSGAKKPKDVSFELCESARKIRLRLRPAMIKEDKRGDMDAYRRLLMLDQTLERTIKRFEDEYPESRPKQSPSMLTQNSQNSSYIDPLQSGPLSRLTSLEDDQDQDHQAEVEEDPYRLKLSRTSSNTSLAVRALTQEEGRMHRFGQSMRREVLKPQGTDDLLHGTSVHDEPEPAHLATLRQRLEGYSGEYIRGEVEARGADAVTRELGIDAQQLRALAKEDPEGFAKLKEAQLTAQLNVGMLDIEDYQRQQQKGKPTVNSAVTAH